MDFALDKLVYAMRGLGGQRSGSKKVGRNEDGRDAVNREVGGGDIFDERNNKIDGNGKD